MVFWYASTVLVVVPLVFFATLSVVCRRGTVALARTYPPVEPAPGARWGPCRVLIVGDTRLAGGVLDAAADDFGLHCWPAGWAEHLGARPFSIPWQAFGEGMRPGRLKGTDLLEATLPNGQRFAADARCFKAVAEAPVA